MPPNTAARLTGEGDPILPPVATQARDPLLARGAVGKAAAYLLERPVLLLFVMLGATFAAYASSFDGDFLWDDTFLVKNNLLIRSPLFCLEAFRHTLFDSTSNFYRPTQTLTYIADYWMWGRQPFGYHLTNVLIQCLNGWLVFSLLCRLLPELLDQERFAGYDAGPSGGLVRGTAFMVALVWVLHPLHSAAVGYISGRADTLAMAFCLLAWLLAGRALRPGVSAAGRGGAAAAAVVCLVLGLCSKEIGLIWPALFLGYLFLFRRQAGSRERWLAVGGVAVAVAAYAFLRHLAPAPPPPPQPSWMPSRWLLLIRALGDYGSLLLFPGKLFMERQVFAEPGSHPSADDRFLYLSLAISGVLLVGAFIGGSLWPGRGQRVRRFGACWFAVAFLPISNLFSLNASVAEHWMYLPSIGFFLFLAGWAVELPRGRGLTAVAAAALLAAGCFGVRTYWRNFDWADELTFFRHTIASGGDVPRARMGLASSYSHLKDDSAAIIVLRRMVAEFPKNRAAQINLANALGRMGRRAEAKPILEKAFATLSESDPREIIAAVASLDLLEDGPDWPARRRALLDDGMRRYPDSWELVQLRIQDFEKAGALSDALALATRYGQAHWWHYPARFTMGRCLARLGRPSEALASFVEASRLDVHDADAFGTAAQVCMDAKRLDEARDFAMRAVGRAPDSPKEHLELAQALALLNDSAGATREFGVATQLLRDRPPAPVEQ